MLILAALLACHRWPCGEDRPCTLPNGTYYAELPASWNEEDALPVVVFAHGYHQSAETYFGDPDVLSAFSDAGVLLLLPEGIDESWSVGPDGLARDDIAFFDDVLADAAQIWPVDPTRVYASGFSLGGSMAYYLGCERAETYAGLYSISGSFWQPVPTDCAGPPLAVGHEHGYNDETWPLYGRQFSEDQGQCSVEEAVALLRAHNGCAEEVQMISLDALGCAVWTDCADGSEVRLCMHDGGHSRRSGWVGRLVSFLLRFDRESG